MADRLVPRTLALTGLIVADALLFAACIGIVQTLRYSATAGSPEERLEDVLAGFFPPWFARLASADITVLTHAVAGMRAFVNPAPATAHSYIHGSKMMIAAIIIALSIVPDAFLFWLVLPARAWWVALSLNVLDVYACLWFFGLYGTMVRRPHEFSREKVLLRNGLCQTVELRPQHIARARPLGIVKRRQLARRRGDGSTVVSLGGVPLVDIVLLQPAIERRLFFAKPRMVTRVFVASDAPEALCRELKFAQ